MATLPTLYPVGDGTQNGVTGTGTAPWYANIDDWAGGGLVDEDSTYISSGVDLGGDGNYLLTDMPANFGTLDSLSLDVRVRRNGTVTDDAMTLTVGIVGADGSTVLAAQKQVASQASGTTYSTVTVSYTDAELASRSNKAAWDGAQLRLVWTYTKTKSSDGLALRVTAVRANGTYTESAGGTPQTIVVGVASETEAAQAVVSTPGVASVLVGASTESEVAQAVAVGQGPGPQTVVVGVATETETAQTVSPPTIATFPTPPPDFTVTPVSSSQIDLSWGAVVGADFYDIERDGVIIEKDYAGVSYSDLGLDPSTLYNYRVRAVKSGA